MQESGYTQVRDEVSVAVPGIEGPQPETAKKRVQSRIQVKILRLCRLPLRRTPIVYRSNLNFKVVKKYLKRLIESGFLICENKIYETTEKGFIWAEKMDLLLLEVGE